MRSGTRKNQIRSWAAVEIDVEEPVHPGEGIVGTDPEVVNGATISDGTIIKPLNSFVDGRRNCRGRLNFLKIGDSKKRRCNCVENLSSRLQSLHALFARDHRSFQPAYEPKRFATLDRKTSTLVWRSSRVIHSVFSLKRRPGGLKPFWRAFLALIWWLKTIRR